MKKIMFCVCLCWILPLISPAQSNDYQKTVEELLVVSGSGEVLQQTIPRIFALLKQQTPGVADAYWEEAEKEITQTASSELAAMMAPVYQKYLTQEELNEIIAFYKTPSGRKLAEVSPRISTEMLTIGQQWGMQLSQKILQQLKDKGHL